MLECKAENPDDLTTIASCSACGKDFEGICREFCSECDREYLHDEVERE